MDSKSFGADIWREVWDVCEDIGEGAEIVKVKAHTSWWDVLGGRITARNRAGNHLADYEAKKALRLAKLEAPAGAFNAHLRRATLWAKWLVKYATNFVKDTTMDQEQAERCRAQTDEGARVEGKQRATMTHEKWKLGERLLCRRCGREEGEEKGSGRALGDACKGSAGGRALAHAMDCANFIWKECRYTEGELIVKGGTMLQASRVPENMVVEGTREQEAPGRAHEGEATRARQASEQAAPWLQDPQWLYLPHLQEDRAEAGKEQVGRSDEEQGGGLSTQWHKGVGGHLLRATGALIWCARCACHAIKRHGTGLKGACVIRRRDATQKRLQRLHAGRHPVTGQLLR